MRGILPYLAVFLLGFAPFGSLEARQCQELFVAMGSVSEGETQQISYAIKKILVHLADASVDFDELQNEDHSEINYAEWMRKGMTASSITQEYQSRVQTRINDIPKINSDSEVAFQIERLGRAVELVERILILSKYLVEIEKYIAHMDKTIGNFSVLKALKKQKLERLSISFGITMNQYSTWLYHVLLDIRESKQTWGWASSHPDLLDKLFRIFKVFSEVFVGSEESDKLEAFKLEEFTKNNKAYFVGYQRSYVSFFQLASIYSQLVLKLSAPGSQENEDVYNFASRARAVLNSAIKDVQSSGQNQFYMDSMVGEFRDLRKDLLFIDAVSNSRRTQAP